MARNRVSATVDSDLLSEARIRNEELTDDALIDKALLLLLRQQRRAEVDATFVAYKIHPLSEPDEWGDLESWHEGLQKLRIAELQASGELEEW